MKQAEGSVQALYGEAMDGAGEAVEAVRKMPGAVEDSMRNGYPDALRGDIRRFQQYRARWLGNDPASYATVYRMLATTDMKHEMTELRCPVLVIGALFDRTRPSAIAKAIADTIPGATYEEFTLEGYGPGGVAILAEINTDNRNRTVSEIRHCFGKNNGNMAEAGAVSWMFHKKGDIVIPKTAAKEDDLMAIVLEAGAEDLKDDGDNWEILTEPSAYEAVLEAVKKAGIEPASSSVAMIPQNYIKLEGSAANTMIRMMEVFEEHDDVQNVHSNFDIDEKTLEEVVG